LPRDTRHGRQDEAPGERSLIASPGAWWRVIPCDTSRRVAAVDRRAQVNSS
jgi:hypothetical protein